MTELEPFTEAAAAEIIAVLLKDGGSPRSQRLARLIDTGVMDDLQSWFDKDVKEHAMRPTECLHTLLDFIVMVVGAAGDAAGGLRPGIGLLIEQALHESGYYKERR